MRQDQLSKPVCLGLMLATLWIGIATANEPQTAKPPGGPVAKPVDDVEARRKGAAKAAEEQRQRQPLIDAQEARDKADLLRASYESANKGTPRPKETTGEFEQVVAAYHEAIDRPISSQETADVVLYCHLRLAGAYQFAGQFDKAVAQGKKAAKEFAGAPQEIRASYELGLIYLQAMHDPKAASEWLQRARELAQTTLEDPQEQAKWLTATMEAMQRCEKEMGKK